MIFIAKKQRRNQIYSYDICAICYFSKFTKCMHPYFAKKISIVSKSIQSNLKFKCNLLWNENKLKFHGM